MCDAPEQRPCLHNWRTVLIVNKLLQGHGVDQTNVEFANMCCLESGIGPVSLLEAFC
jgi:hypothetical protein